MKHKKYELFSTVIYPLKKNWEKIGPGKNATDQVIIYTPTGWTKTVSWNVTILCTLY